MLPRSVECRACNFAPCCWRRNDGGGILNAEEMKNTLVVGLIKPFVSGFGDLLSWRTLREEERTTVLEFPRTRWARTSLEPSSRYKRTS